MLVFDRQHSTGAHGVLCQWEAQSGGNQDVSGSPQSALGDLEHKQEAGMCCWETPISGVCHYIQLSISWLLCIVIIDIDGLIDRLMSLHVNMFMCEDACGPQDA